ncbi:ATP-grasp domain-containing protein [Streptomyces lancefieldiae]|uniref:ATP-grasp domain-containing protein n=1 Tax=Streptomyces lancefieldiae TaxID=3075520 RepID=A0ABU3AQP6_9ACTN|nr:ATP-grasp domain-containing protein [Streptomyces sp. DSM 40712]MDT0612520.1 ATP-grasp domain-containing protein [Streptomyces sp. DSM 40712]
MSPDRSVLHLGLRRSPLEWRPELDAAAELGHAVYVHSDTGLGHTGLPDDRVAVFTRTESAEDVAARALRQARDGGHEPAAVLCWGDRYVDVAAKVAEALGLHGPSVAAAAVCLDKAAQRRALEPHGLNPRWRSGTTADELTAAVAELGLPLIFKLAHSSGGRGSAVIDEHTEPDGLVKLTSLNYEDSDAFLVEEFVDGSEHSVSGFVHRDEVVILAVSDKYLAPGELRTTTTIVPSALAPEQLARVHEAAERAVRAVGIETGGFHVDLRCSAEGPVVLEIGARLGGDLINSHLVPLATGGAAQPYRSLVETLTDGELPRPAPFVTTAAMHLLPVPADSDLSALLHRLTDHPAVRIAAEWPSPEDEVVVVVTAQDADAIPTILAELRQRTEHRGHMPGR